MRWWSTLTIVDKAQVISAIATAIAAITALITTIQNHKSIKNQREERHAIIKPHFVITHISEDRIKNKYKIEVENLGYNVLNGIVARWVGTENAEVSLDKRIDKNKNILYVIQLKFDEERNDSEDIKGKLILSYVDILGKKYNEEVSIAFNAIYNDDAEKYYLCLENIYSKHFS